MINRVVRVILNLGLAPPTDAPVIAANDGWLPLTEHTAADVARSAMFLACSPKHVVTLRDQAAQHALAGAADSVDLRR